jgi:hypothetical protein
MGTASRIKKLRWNGIWELRWNRNSMSCNSLRADASASLTFEFYAMTDTWLRKGDPSAIMHLPSLVCPASRHGSWRVPVRGDH